MASAERWRAESPDLEDDVPTHRIIQSADRDDLLAIETQDGPMAAWRELVSTLRVDHVSKERVADQSDIWNQQVKLKNDDGDLYELEAMLTDDGYAATLTLRQGGKRFHHGIEYPVTNVERVYLKLDWTVLFEIPNLGPTAFTDR